MSDTLQASAMPQVQAKSGVVAYLAVDGAMKAAELYKKAFAAELAFAHPVDEQGRTMHVHLYVNGSSLMLGDFFPEHGHAYEKPAGFTIQLIVDDCRAWYDRAVAAGCTSNVEPQVMFWGDTWAQVQDPFGFVWAFDQPAA